MRRTTAVALASVLVGIGIGMVPSARSASATYTYRCLSSFVADGGTSIWIYNPTGELAKLHITTWTASGVEDTNVTSSVDTHQTVGKNFESPVTVMEVRSRTKLLVAGDAKYLFGSNPDVIRQIRCT